MSNVAQEIAKQIGRSFVMMGAKDLVGSDNSLRFRLGRGAKDGITHITVTLDANDTYTVAATKWNARKLENKLIESVSGVYCDSLRAVIGGMTGFAMTL